MQLEVEAELLLGRAAGETRGLRDPKLSRRHAVVRRSADGTLTIEDLGSTNGTFVNGERLSEPRSLTAGDLVQIGDTTLEVTIAPTVTDGLVAQHVPTHQVGSPTALRPALSGPATGHAILLYDQRRAEVSPTGITIGREPTSDVVVDSERASRSHARVGISDGQYYVADLGSVNGTYLNGERLLDEARWLGAGDTIVVADTAFRFVTGRETHLGSAPTLGSGPHAISFDGGRLSIGRDPANDVCLDAPTISRFHAEIVGEVGGGVELRDLGSRNGTRLDGAPVTRASIRIGSEVGIGPFRLVFDGAEFVQRDDRGALRLDAYDVSVAVQSRVILDAVTLSIQPGEFVAVIGESGSGKTTLMRVLAGVSRPSRGAVLLNGESVRARLSDIGYLPQNEIVHARLTIAESLGYSARLRLPLDSTTAEIQAAVERVMRDTGLEQHARTRIGSLSGGQRKRVGLATELLNSPGVLFLDEPTTGLDPGLETRMMELFRELAAVGSHAVFVVTHATRNLELVDRLCVMGRGGNLCFFGEPSDARRFFAVSSFDDIYGVLDERPPEEWRERFEHSVASTPPPAQVAAATIGMRRGVRAKSAFGQQTGVLTRRYFKVLQRDRRSLVLLLAQAPFLAAAIALLFKPEVFAGAGRGIPSSAAQLLFTMVVTMAWLGTISSAREVIKEAAVFLRERAVGVRVDAYVASKVAVLLPLVALQAAIDAGLTWLDSR